MPSKGDADETQDVFARVQNLRRGPGAVAGLHRRLGRLDFSVDSTSLGGWLKQYPGDGKPQAGKTKYKERAAIAAFPHADCRNRVLTQFRVRGLVKAKAQALWRRAGVQLAAAAEAALSAARSELFGGADGNLTARSGSQQGPARSPPGSGSRVWPGTKPAAPPDPPKSETKKYPPRGEVKTALRSKVHSLSGQ
jgi:hypothetical protein